MFGGLAFLVAGNMAVAASGQGGLMGRVDPDDTDTLVTKPHARPFETCAVGRCRAGCASTPTACEPRASSSPGEARRGLRALAAWKAELRYGVSTPAFRTGHM